MNLRLNLMKWACVVLALAAVACDDDEKKTLPGGETTEGERTRTSVSYTHLTLPTICSV